MAKPSFTSDNLTLYLSYEYLTAEQLSRIILATDQLYQNLARTLIFGQSDYLNSSMMVAYPVPLCISHVATGNSIDVHFRFEKRFFPQLKFKDDELNIALPEWSAVLLITGAILGYGLDKYNTYLEIQHNLLENQKLRYEIQAQQMQMENLKSQPANPQIQSISENVLQFRKQIYQKNINWVDVNKETIYSKEKP